MDIQVECACRTDSSGKACQRRDHVGGCFGASGRRVYVSDTMTGFSLVEIMVALVIGMFGVLVMMQVLGLFENQKRTTTGGDDAVAGGAIALYGIQRLVQHSGWGINSPAVLGCTVKPDPAFATAFNVNALPLVPVSINNTTLVPAGDANTDTLLIVSGAGTGSVEGDEWKGANVATPSAFSDGERVFTVPFSGSCADRLLGKYTEADPGSSVDTSGTTRIYNLGDQDKGLVIHGYAIRSGNLTECDYVHLDCSSAANWTIVANNIVSLRAVYGRDTSAAAVSGGNVAKGSMDGTVDEWDQTVPTPATGNLKKDTLACSWARVSAVHVVLVARSSKAERRQEQGSLTGQVASVSAVTASAPTWEHSGVVAIDLTDTSPDATWPTWQDFRYKVFQTVVPLRNITSKGVMPEC